MKVENREKKNVFQLLNAYTASSVSEEASCSAVEESPLLPAKRTSRNGPESSISPQAKPEASKRPKLEAKAKPSEPEEETKRVEQAEES